MRGRDVLVLALVGVTVAACGSSPTSPPPTTTTSPTIERYGAPIVSSPRDIRDYTSRPCDLLTAPERLQLDLSGSGRQRTSIDAQECSWPTSEDGELAMAVDADRDLLADTYRTRLMRIFVPTTVDGMPAVRQRMALNDNTCTVTTGLGPTQALETEWSGPMDRQTLDPCARAEQAIALIIRKLPPQR